MSTFAGGEASSSLARLTTLGFGAAAALAGLGAAGAAAGAATAGAATTGFTTAAAVGLTAATAATVGAAFLGAAFLGLVGFHPSPDGQHSALALTVIVFVIVVIIIMGCPLGRRLLAATLRGDLERRGRLGSLSLLSCQGQ